MLKIENKRLMQKIIPKEYHFSHEFSFFLHDILAGIVKKGEKNGIFNVSIEFNSTEMVDEFTKRKGAELWDWLECHSFKSVTKELVIKQSIVALLADLCHFVHEALCCSQKGKLTVTYALLRKPFKENLFYLEWILAYPDEFYSEFEKQTSKNIAVDLIESLKKRDVIKAAIEKTKYGIWVPPDFIYDMRYNKDALYGLESYWNKATHLITTFKKLKTGDLNFNFIFSNEEDRISQWNILYKILPLLLFYTLEIVHALIKNISELETEPEDPFYDLRKLIGFSLWCENQYPTCKEFKLLELARENFEFFDFVCPFCKRKISFGKRNLKSFFYFGKLKCWSCNTTIEHS